MEKYFGYDEIIPNTAVDISIVDYTALSQQKHSPIAFVLCVDHVAVFVSVSRPVVLLYSSPLSKLCDTAISTCKKKIIIKKSRFRDGMGTGRA